MGEAVMGIPDDVSSTELNPSLAATLRFGQVQVYSGNPTQIGFDAGRAFRKYGISLVTKYMKDNDIKDYNGRLNLARNLYRNPFGTSIDIGVQGGMISRDSLGTKSSTFTSGGGFNLKPLPSFSFTGVYDGLGIKKDTAFNKTYGYGLTYFFLDMGSLGYNRIKIGDDWFYKLGIEFFIQDKKTKQERAFARIGSNDGYLTTGAGFRVSKFGLDIGMQNHGKRNNFKASLTYFFGEENL